MKYAKFGVSLLLVILLAMSFSVSVLAAERNPIEHEDNYIEIDITPEMLRAVSPLSRSFGTLNAFFPQGATYAESNYWAIDFQDDSLPLTAEVTRVEVSSSRTAVAGITYYMHVGRTLPGFNEPVFCPGKLWASTLTFNDFNSMDPWGIWWVAFSAERTILPGIPDFGAGATVPGGTLKVYWR